MTNLKKVLAFVVVFAMMLTFSVSANSFPDVEESASYAESVSILSSLGLMIGDEEGNFNPDKTITRAEAATIIVRAKGLEDAAAGAKGATQFTDVAADHWASGYINLACQNGIVAGYGDGTFGPEDEVTYEQITKMIVAALGYTPMANKQGGYPTGYLVIASQKGIAKGTTGQAGEPAARATVARLLYNALTVNMMEQTVYSAGSEEYGEVEKTLLYDFLDIDVYEGVVTGSYLTAQTVDVDNTDVTITYTKENNVVTTAQPIIAKAGSTNAADYLGYAVVAYIGVDDETDDDTILAIAPKTNKNQTVAIDYSQLEDVVKTGSDITRVDYLAKETDRSATKLNLSTNNNFYYNGRLDAGRVETFLTQSTLTPGTVTFLDNGNDSDYDYVFVTAYTKDYVVGEIYASQNRLVDKNGSNISDVRIDDENVICNFYFADGTPATFEDIKVNDTLTTAISGDKALVAVYICDKVVEGAVSESRTDDEDYFTIDGEEYRLSTNSTSNVNVKVGDDGKFFLNVDNRIVRKEATSLASIENYAYIYDVANETGGFEDAVQIQCLTAAGEWKIFDVAKKLTINEYSSTNAQFEGRTISDSTAAGSYGIYDIASNGTVTANQQLFQYKTNSSGKIHTIWLAAGTDTDDGISLDASADDKSYNASTVRLGGQYLQKETIVFNVPQKGTAATDTDEVTIGTVASTFNESGTYTADFYDIEDYPTVVVAYGAKAALDDSTRLFVISKITQGNNASGTSVDRFYGYQEGEYVNAYASEDGVEVQIYGAKEDANHVAYDVNDIQAGDAVIFSLDLNGDIDTINVVMQAAAAIGAKDDQDNAMDYTFFYGDTDEACGYFGWAKATGTNNRMTVSYDDGSAVVDETIMFKGTYNVYNVNLNRTNPVVSVSDYGDIEAGVDTPKYDTDYIFVRMYEGSVVDVVVYTFTLDE